MPHINDTTSSAIVAFAVSDELAKAIDAAAAEDLLSRSAFVRRIMVDYVRRSGHLAPEARILNSIPAVEDRT